MKSFNDAVAATYIGVQLSYDTQELINNYTSSSRGDPKLIEVTTENGTGVIDFEIPHNSLSGGCYIKKTSGSPPSLINQCQILMILKLASLIEMMLMVLSYSKILTRSQSLLQMGLQFRQLKILFPRS